MNTAPRLGFPASLDSNNLRNKHSGALPAVKNRELSTEFETPSPRGEGVTPCPCCNDEQYLQIDEHEVERCPFC